MDKYRGSFGVGNIRFDDLVATRFRRVNLPIDQRIVIDELDLLCRVIAFAIDERCPVRHRKLKRTNVSGVTARVIDLAQYTIGKGIPYFGVGACRGAKTLLISGHPVESLAREPRRLSLSMQGWVFLTKTAKSQFVSINSDLSPAPRH